MNPTPSETSLDPRVARLIDANLDRAREGLRVVEDWCRFGLEQEDLVVRLKDCLLYTSPSPRDRTRSRMPSSA